MKAKQYRVTAGYVTVETAVPGGRALIDVHRGKLLPPDVPQAQIDTELRLGTIEPEEVEVVAAPSTVDTGDNTPPAGGPADPAAMPDGMSVPTTLEWVGTDAARAAVALAAEETGQNRKTLVARLQEVIAAAEAEGAKSGADSGAGASVDS